MFVVLVSRFEHIYLENQNVSSPVLVLSMVFQYKPQLFVYLFAVDDSC